MKGLSTVSQEFEKCALNYVKLLCLLYADDTVLLAESQEDLQLMIDAFSQYCYNWKLNVNISKTKLHVFSKCRIPNNLNLFLEVLT